MIVEWLLALGADMSAWFAGLQADWTPPVFLTEFATNLNSLLADLNGVGVWADWAYILAIVGIVLATWGITFAIKIVRAIASYIPFFGGAG